VEDNVADSTVDGRRAAGLVSVRRPAAAADVVVVRRIAIGVPVPLRVRGPRPGRRRGVELRRRGVPRRPRAPAEKRAGVGVHAEGRRPSFRAHATVPVHR